MDALPPRSSYSRSNSQSRDDFISPDKSYDSDPSPAQNVIDQPESFPSDNTKLDVAPPIDAQEEWPKAMGDLMQTCFEIVNKDLPKPLYRVSCNPIFERLQKVCVGHDQFRRVGVGQVSLISVEISYVDTKKKADRQLKEVIQNCCTTLQTVLGHNYDNLIKFEVRHNGAPYFTVPPEILTAKEKELGNSRKSISHKSASTSKKIIAKQAQNKKFESASIQAEKEVKLTLEKTLGIPDRFFQWAQKIYQKTDKNLQLKKDLVLLASIAAGFWKRLENDPDFQMSAQQANGSTSTFDYKKYQSDTEMQAKAFDVYVSRFGMRIQPQLEAILKNANPEITDEQHHKRIRFCLELEKKKNTAPLGTALRGAADLTYSWILAGREILVEASSDLAERIKFDLNFCGAKITPQIRYLDFNRKTGPNGPVNVIAVKIHELSYDPFISYLEKTLKPSLGPKFDNVILPYEEGERQPIARDKAMYFECQPQALVKVYKENVLWPELSPQDLIMYRLITNEMREFKNDAINMELSETERSRAATRSTMAKCVLILYAAYIKYRSHIAQTSATPSDKVKVTAGVVDLGDAEGAAQERSFAYFLVNNQAILLSIKQTLKAIKLNDLFAYCDKRSGNFSEGHDIHNFYSDSGIRKIAVCANGVIEGEMRQKS